VVHACLLAWVDEHQERPGTTRLIDAAGGSLALGWWDLPDHLFTALAAGGTIAGRRPWGRTTSDVASSRLVRCKPIKLAKKSSYRLRLADRGRRVRAVATAHNALGATVVRSKPSAVVH
jgi:hypothetical protein